MDEWKEVEIRIEKILGEDNERNRKNAIRFKNYLLENLILPIRITGIEDFPWEESYIIGYFSEKEYEVMKKTNPSYTDEFYLIDIQDPNEYDDCIAKIKRITDKKHFLYGLSWFETIDHDNEAFKILDAYSKWHCNY